MTNDLLGLLPECDRQLILKESETVDLPLRLILVEADEPIENVYFPTRGVVSQVTLLNDGSAVEVAMIGNDGFIGLSAYLGSFISPSRFIVQLAGEALRLPAARLRLIAQQNEAVRVVLSRYTDYLLAVAAQTAACNRVHNVEQRCARWLLRVRDRTNSNEFPLTQEFLSQMLGVRRASVSIAAGDLQTAGLIRYAYGRITIVDQEGLEKLSCECTGVMRRRYETMVRSTPLGDRSVGPPK